MWSSKARLGKRKGQFQYSENAVFEKRKFFNRTSSVGAVYDRAFLSIGENCDDIISNMEDF
jgi:hypothetical protein